MDEHENEQVYEALAEHLDRLPGGFAPGENGEHLRLLRYLFTPQEAALAVHLSIDSEAPEAIAARVGLGVPETVGLLEQMAVKGLIHSAEMANGPRRYHALPLIVGIYEMQLNRLDGDFLRRWSSYWRNVRPRPELHTAPQMRVVPVGESVESLPEALPYQRIGALVAAQERFAVLECICRKIAGLNDRACDAPLESCLAFGDWADLVVRTGRGRSIDRAEVLEIVRRADEANLVLQPSNSRDIAFVCCCCGCCCGSLRGLKRQPKPAEAVANDYIAAFEADLCVNCGTCLRRCQMEALSEGNEHVLFNAERCIGCGLCVSTCPSGALTLVLKPEHLLKPLPETLLDTWRTIIAEQAQQRSAAPDI
jgi:electron transport complex protein RnfB